VTADEPTYVEALAELEAILDELDQETVDVDLLAERVKRASELVQLCRSRIQAAEIVVTKIIDGLDDPNSM